MVRGWTQKMLSEENSHKKSAHLRRTTHFVRCSFSAWNTTPTDHRVTHTGRHPSWPKTRSLQLCVVMSACRRASKRARSPGLQRNRFLADEGCCGAAVRRSQKDQRSGQERAPTRL